MSASSSLPGARLGPTPAAQPATETAGDSPVLEAARPVRDAFDGLATGYDREFTDSLIGSLQREAVWRCLDGLFASGARILDLGCGTGADAIHFAQRGIEVEAVDVSPSMIAQARSKIAAANLSARITATVLPIEELATWDRQSCLSTQASEYSHAVAQGQTETTKENDTQDCLSHQFEGALSNFGTLNCVSDLRPVARTLGRLVRPGGHLAVCLISRFCLWETLFYALQGRFAKAARRWSNGGVATASLPDSAPFPVYYRTVREVVEVFRPEFRLQRRYGIGIVIPPTYVERYARRFPRLTRFAAAVDRSIAAWPCIRATADHTLLVFHREHSS